MDNTLDYLSGLVLSYPEWSYAIIAAGILLQGEITILLSMYLIAHGDLSWYGFLFSTIPALIIGESFIYWFGRSLRHTRFGWRLYRRLKASRRMHFYSYHITQNLTKLVVASKFLLGTNLMLMLLIGWLRTKFMVFMKAYLTGAMLWFATMTVVSYSLMSGLNELRSAHILRQIEFIFAGVLMLIFIGEYLLRKQIKKRAFGETIKPEDLKTLVEEEIKNGTIKNPAP